MATITNEKIVLQAAQAVLACDQEAYRKIRQLLRPDRKELTAGYDLLRQVEKRYYAIPSSDLPQITNALYHMAGYFKNYFTQAERQRLHQRIQTNPEQALIELEAQSRNHGITYLVNTRLWSEKRRESWNMVPIPVKYGGNVYQPNDLLWVGEKLVLNSR